MSTPKALFVIKPECWGRKPRTFDDVTLSVEDIYEEDGLFCPLCGKYSEEENEGLQYDDYVTHPMIWNWICCDCHCVLLENTVKKLTLKEAKAEFPQHANKLDQIESTAVACLSIDCAKIKRISNHQLYDYVLKEDEQITEEEIRKFISSGEDERIVERPTDEDGSTNMEDVENEYLFDLSLPVNSYDSEAPEVPYPKNMDLAHDGIFIYLLCEDENGKEFRVCYWGD
jgi:hypothetical protein